MKNINGKEVHREIYIQFIMTYKKNKIQLKLFLKVIHPFFVRHFGLEICKKIQLLPIAEKNFFITSSIKKQKKA